MRLCRWFAPLLIGCAVGLLAQDAVDREGYAREYVRFLVAQLAQWSKEFPREFNAALLKPPVDATKLSDAAKAGPTQFGEDIERLVSLGNSKDLVTNAEFRSRLERALAAMKEVNQAMASQRFPSILQSDWDQIRSTLNNLARVYSLETLAALEPPAAPVKPKAPGGGLSGYIVDLSCARRGKGMWVNAECVARCVRDGDKVVLVTEAGKIYQIANQDKVAPETYGQMVTVIGKTVDDTVTVESLKQ